MLAQGKAGGPVTLHIPDIPEDADNLTAAMAYTDAGLYVLPVDLNVGDGKNPGSVVGDGWPAKSSQDPKQITAWFAGTDYGIALHAGRSGAVILDVDEPDNVPDEVALVMESGGPYQSTRDNQPGRGHYLLANTTGRRIGNSLGKLARDKKWGEVRGANGVIIVAPSKHPSGGCYRWQRTGPLPAMPDYLDEALPDSTTPEDTASDEQVEAFLDAHTTGTRTEALAGLVNTLEGKLARGASCHMSTLGVVTDAMAEAAAGLYPARAAKEQLAAVYKATATTGTSTGRKLTDKDAHHEFAGIVAWAVGQATPEKAAQAQARVEQKLATAVTVVDDISGDTPAPATDRQWLDWILAAEGTFWQSRDSLTQVLNAAHARMSSPWAVLGHCAARALTWARPKTVLPPLIGGPGSLNSFFVVTAASGGGKSAAAGVARDLIDQYFEQRTLGSGEGFLDAFTRPKDDETGEPAGYYEAILFQADESDTISALSARSGSTLLATLRTAWVADTIGFGYRGRTREKLDAHTYRACLVVSMQNARAGWLIDDAGGGTPQRFMWFPATDPRVSRTNWTGNPLPRLNLPHWQQFQYPKILTVPDAARDAVHEAHERRQRGEGDALDGHALFCRLKFAYALTVLDGRTDMTDEDWELSGIAAEISARTREWVRHSIARAESEANVRIGRARGEQQTVAEESKDELLARRNAQVRGWLVKKLAAGPATTRELTLAAPSSSRRYLPGVLAVLKADGVIVDEDVKASRGPAGSRWSLL